MLLLESLSLQLFLQKCSYQEVPAYLKHEFHIKHMRDTKKQTRTDIVTFMCLL